MLVILTQLDMLVFLVLDTDMERDLPMLKLMPRFLPPHAAGYSGYPYTAGYAGYPYTAGYAGLAGLGYTYGKRSADAEADAQVLTTPYTAGYAGYPYAAGYAGYPYAA